MYSQLWRKLQKIRAYSVHVYTSMEMKKDRDVQVLSSSWPLSSREQSFGSITLETGEKNGESHTPDIEEVTYA